MRGVWVPWSVRQRRDAGERQCRGVSVYKKSSQARDLLHFEFALSSQNAGLIPKSDLDCLHVYELQTVSGLEMHLRVHLRAMTVPRT